MHHFSFLLIDDFSCIISFWLLFFNNPPWVQLWWEAYWLIVDPDSISVPNLLVYRFLSIPSASLSPAASYFLSILATLSMSWRPDFKCPVTVRMVLVTTRHWASEEPSVSSLLRYVTFPPPRNVQPYSIDLMSTSSPPHRSHGSDSDMVLMIVAGSIIFTDGRKWTCTD